MENRKRRLKIFESLADDGSPTDYSSTIRSIQDISLSFVSQSSVSICDDSSIGEFPGISKPDLLSQTIQPTKPDFLKSKLSNKMIPVHSLADKYTRGVESKKTENKVSCLVQDVGQKKIENCIQNSSTDESSKEDLSTRGQPKKRPLVESEKKYFVVKLELIRSGQDSRTTVMVKNIPNKYTQKMILQTIDKKFKGNYDFLYLPIDFKNRCNVGYAFINFLDYKAIADFYLEFNGKRWEKFNSEKVCEIAYGRIQGLKALVRHFQNSTVINQEDHKIKPVIFTKN